MKIHYPIISIALGLLLSTQGVFAENPSAPEKAAEEKNASAAELDFGDFSSKTLTSKAWDALNAKNYTNAKAFAQKCIDTYKAQALTMQESLDEPATEKEEVHKSWALNDVGTSFFILGQALEAEGKNKEAIAAYKLLAEKLPFAQCWDANGWFWKPADAAKEKAKALEFEELN